MRASLEIDRNQRGLKDGSLLSVVDRTVTGAGARLLKQRLNSPLIDSSEINKRLDSVGFFITNKAQKKIGNYNTKFKYSADRDLIYRLIKKHRLKGLPTKKKDVLGTFSLKGLSSRLSFAEKTLEEIRIRMSNKQNMIQVISITIVFLVYYFFKLFQTKKIK